ncbi:MAG: tetratricopeptide repeat protein [Methanocellales archaeon]|nr:tetratricopeptide repeat protein [Methanocellales archaeon]MDD5484897.1 tetratricopeptide repeat protein [Methanocellales archaeon]
MNPLRELLVQKGFKPKLLSDEALPDEHLGERFEKLVDECVLGIVILDGHRPNVIFEYGFLRGKNRHIIPIQGRNACVAIKSFYSIGNGTDQEVKSATGMTQDRFNQLKNPPICYFDHLSNRKGIKAIEVDQNAPLDSPDHPKNKVGKELDKIMPELTKEYHDSSLNSIRKAVPLYSDRFDELSLKVSGYYSDREKLGVGKLEKAIEETIEKIKNLERDSGTHISSQIYGTISSLYSFLAEKAEWKDTPKIIDNYNRALGICERILEFEPDPVQISEIQIKRGSIYWALSKYQDRKENCKKAIKAYDEALKVYTLERFPIQYATTQNNLGAAYDTLAEVESKAENCKKAIKAYDEALKVCTLERFPMDYAMTQNNLGVAYHTLAEVESKAENCKKAIKACEEALKVYTLERFPIQYAMTQNNLGVAYHTLAEVESKAENCKKAIKACEEALKVRTLERFPMDYAMTQNNLGIAYRTLAEVESKAENCKKAIKAYGEALKVFTEEDFPEIYPVVERNLRNLINFCEGK